MWQVMTLGVDEFIRRFLLHILPRGFHRIRNYGLLSASARRANLARARELLAVAPAGRSRQMSIHCVHAAVDA